MPRRNLTPLQRQEMGLSADLSWQRFTYCRICGRRICVNNFPDHEVRLPRVRGIITCGYCAFRHSGETRGDRGAFVTGLYSFTAQIAKRFCESDDDLACGRCPPCVARKVMALSPTRKREVRKAALFALNYGGGLKREVREVQEG